MRTRIIAAFPGTGKSMYHQKHPLTTLDSDSSELSWVEDEEGSKIRNPEFPNNYIQHIKDNIGKYEFIFVSTHQEVITALLDACIFFYAVYPDDRRKEEFLERYRARGSSEGFITLVDTNWDKWLHDATFHGPGCKWVNMVLDNLENELDHIMRSENGCC